MASTYDISALRKSFEQIRDEKGTHANTATRIGDAFLSLLGFVNEGGDRYLSSVDDDEAHGIITFLKGLLLGTNGSGVTIDSSTGDSYMTIDRLKVRLKAYFEELEVAKRSCIAGKEQVTAGGGKVVAMVSNVTDDSGGITAYRCYYLAEQEGEAIDVTFKEEDTLISEDFNAKAGIAHAVSNHFYWRRCVAAPTETVEIDGKKYYYVDLSADDCAAGSDTPAAGDTIVHLGTYPEDGDSVRQNAIIISSIDSNSPSITLYQGISKFTLDKHDFVTIGFDPTSGQAKVTVYGDMYVGDREGTTYIKYDQEKKKVSIKGYLEVGTTLGGEDLQKLINDAATSGGLTEEQVTNIANTLVSPYIEEIQKQVDGAIETWFYDGVPTLENEPASAWTDDDTKNNHLGDLYYDNKTGKAYRFAYDNSTNAYSWNIITDTDVVKALADAKNAQATADGKMKVFVNTPETPWQVGDMWLCQADTTIGSTKFEEGNIYRATTAKSTGEITESDWVKADKYTDDTVAKEARQKAEQAQTDIKEAKEKYDSWAEDSVISPLEKQEMLAEIERIDAYTDEIKSQYATYSMGSVPTAYTTAYNNYKAFLEIFTAKDTWENNISIADTKIEDESITFAAAQNTYYTQRSTCMNAIATAAEKQVSDLDKKYSYLTGSLSEAVKLGLTKLNGLILSNAIALRDADESIMAGINGLASASNIAAWFGGDMIDKEALTDESTEQQKDRAAKTLFRMDGSGYIANDNISWKSDGTLTFNIDNIAFSVGGSSKNATEYLEQLWIKSDKNSDGTYTAIAPILDLALGTHKITGDLTAVGNGIFGYIDGSSYTDGAYIQIGGVRLVYDSEKSALKVVGADGSTAANFYATGGVSARGISDSGSSGGGSSYGLYRDSTFAQAIGTDDMDAISASVGKSLYDAIVSNDGDISSLASRVAALESGGNLGGISESGTGNAYSSFTLSDDGKSLVLNKGITALTSIKTPTGLTTTVSGGVATISLTSGYVIPTTTQQSNWNTVYNWYTGITGTDTDDVINRWDEIVAFLDGVSESDTLESLLASIGTNISGVSTRVTTLEGYFTDGVANNADQLDGFEASGLFQSLAFSGQKLTIQIGGTSNTATIPYATASVAGLVSTGTQTFAGAKTFNSAIYAKNLLSVTKTLTVAGATTLKSTLAVTGKTTLTGLLTANGNIVTASSIKIGSITLEYDSVNSALHITHDNDSEGNEVLANFYASGGITARGVGSDTSGGSSWGLYSGTGDLTNDDALAAAYGVSLINAKASTDDLNSLITRVETLENDGTSAKLEGTVGSAALPIWLNDGVLTACTATSVFSALANSGNNISVTVAGKNRTLTVGYASYSAYLKKNSSFSNSTVGRVSYYDAEITNTTNNSAWSSPDSGWHQILHLDLSVSNYWTELAFPVNDVKGLAWRQRRTSSYYGWYRLLDSNNYTSYVTKLGTSTVGSSTLPIYLDAGQPTACGTTLGVSITGNAATATTASKVANAFTVNGTSFNGSAAKSVTITASSLGAITTSNYSSYITKSYVDGLGISASYATSASNADTVDGYHASSFVLCQNNLLFSQYQSGYYMRLLTFTITSGTLYPTISFTWYPTEMNRGVWADFNINIRSNDISFTAAWNGTETRTLYCVGDGTTFYVWVAVDKTTYDGYGSIVHKHSYGVNSYSYGIAYSDTLPTGTYGTTCQTGGIVNYANSAGNADTVDGHHFNWSGQSGQPTWLWGGNDSTNMYVWNPSNFSVNYASSAGNASTLGGYGSDSFVKKSGDTMSGALYVGSAESRFWYGSYDDPASGITTAIKVSGGFSATGNIYLATNSGSVSIGSTLSNGKLYVAGDILATDKIVSYNYFDVANYYAVGDTKLRDACISQEGDEDFTISLDAQHSLIVQGSILATGGITARSLSDLRLKNNLGSEDYKEKLLALGDVFNYTFNDTAKERKLGYRDDKEHIGLAYQKVKEVLPTVCGEAEDGYGYINYISPDLISLTVGALQQNIKAVKKEELRVKNLEEKVKSLKQENMELKKRIEEMERRVSVC